MLLGLALVFHGELARTRPTVEHLTEFYLCISIGGVLGGIFNSLVAPVVFHTVMELPLVLVFAALIRPLPSAASKWKNELLGPCGRTGCCLLRWESAWWL